MEFLLPCRRRDFVFEDLLQQAHHDRDGGRRAGGCTQQPGNGAVLGRDNLGAQFQDATGRFVTLDHLYALACLPQTPILGFGVGEVFLQGIDTIRVRQHQLTREVLDQWILLDANAGHRPRIVCGGGTQQVEIRALLEKLGAEGGERAKQDQALAVEHAGVQMRNRHRWRAH
ncbi:hypothetical protein D3C85_1028460 [compost metagenome]